MEGTRRTSLCEKLNPSSQGPSDTTSHVSLGNGLGKKKIFWGIRQLSDRDSPTLLQIFPSSHLPILARMRLHSNAHPLLHMLLHMPVFHMQS